MIDAASKALFHTLAQVDTLRRLVSRYGMRPGGFARRFIAGETVEEAIKAVAALPGRGLRLTLDYLGESVASFEEARPRRRSTSASSTPLSSPAPSATSR